MSLVYDCSKNTVLMEIVILVSIRTVLFLYELEYYTLGARKHSYQFREALRVKYRYNKIYRYFA